MPGGAVTGEVVVPVSVGVVGAVIGVVVGVVVGVVTGITPGVVTVPVLVVVTGVGTGVVLIGVDGTCEGRESSSPSCRGRPSWRSERNKSCKNAWRSYGSELGTAPEDAPAVPLVPLAVVVAAGVVVAVVVVVAGVEVAPVVPGVPVPAAFPAEWLVTNCVNAASSAVNKVPPPPGTLPPCMPPPESESPSLSVLLGTLRVAFNKVDRLAAGLVPDTAFVVMVLSLFEISTRRSRASPCGHCATHASHPRSRCSSRPAADLVA
jgi:hypothetical protein